MHSSWVMYLLCHLLLSAKLVFSWLMGLEKPSGLAGLKGCKAMLWLSWKLVAAACAWCTLSTVICIGRLYQSW